MSTWYALAVLTAAIGLTYVFCVRPMRRGQCDMSGATTGATGESERRDEIAQLRTEIAQVRRELQTNPPRPQTP